MTKSWNHNPDVKKRQDFLGGQKRNSDGPFSAFDQCQTLQCRSPVVPQRLAVVLGSGPEGLVGPGRGGSDLHRQVGLRGVGGGTAEPAERGLFYRKRQTTLRNSCGSPPNGTNVPQAQRARRRSSQGRAGGQQPGRPGGHTQTPPDDPLSTNDTGTMRQCPRSPDTTTAQADKPQPIPMKPLRKTARIVKSLGSRHTVM